MKKRHHESINVTAPTRDRAKRAARARGVTIGHLVELACAREIEAGEHLIGQPGATALEMFRIARPEVPK